MKLKFGDLLWLLVCANVAFACVHHFIDGPLGRQWAMPEGKDILMARGRYIQPEIVAETWHLAMTDELGQHRRFVCEPYLSKRRRCAIELHDQGRLRPNEALDVRYFQAPYRDVLGGGTQDVVLGVSADGVVLMSLNERLQDLRESAEHEADHRRTDTVFLFVYAALLAWMMRQWLVTRRLDDAKPK